MRILLILLAAISFFSSAAQEKEINLQLKWWHQFQFAGFYAANIKGFYRDAGLKVNIRQGDRNIHPVNEVVEGRADFAVGGSEILTDFIKGADIKVIGAIFQHSPYTIISLTESGINSPTDLVGKRVMLALDQGWIQLQAMLVKEGLPPTTIKKLRHTWNNRDLINGYADAMSGYTSVEVIQLEMQGHRVNQLKPISYGIDFYGDVLFTSSDMVNDDHELVEAFRTASFKGWEYAMNNMPEMVNYILTIPGVKERGVTRQSLLLEANKMRELIIHDLVEIGHMNPGRWEHMLSVYKSLNLVDKDASLDDFIYNPHDTTLNKTFTILSYIFVALFLIFLLLFVYSYNMKKAVKKRTVELELEVKRRKENEESLKRLSDELQISNNELKQFAYVTSHNLRAPVSNLLSLVKLFDRNMLNEKNSVYFAKIGMCTENLNTMLMDLNEILSVRTKENEKSMLLDLESETEFIKSNISENIIETGTLITTDFSKAPSIYYPRKNIHNIFQNLFTNSIKYRKPGIPVHIDIVSEQSGNDTIIKFSDNGIGINLRKHGEKLFNLYERFSTDTEGKGLGLYIVKTQVEKAGGKIEVESEENIGTRFILTLKNSKPDEPAS